MSFALNYDNLLKYLNKKELEPTFQKETGQVFILLSFEDLKIPLFFGIQPDSPLLQGIAYLPYQVHEESFGQTARLLHRINRELDLPGFGMGEQENFLFYRFVIPCLKREVKEELLDSHLGALCFAVETFMYAIGTVAGEAKKDLMTHA